jgi:hypothetical protein
MAQIVYIFLQNNFHVKLSSIRPSQISQESEIARTRLACAAGNLVRHLFLVSERHQGRRNRSPRA